MREPPIRASTPIAAGVTQAVPSLARLAPRISRTASPIRVVARSDPKRIDLKLIRIGTPCHSLPVLLSTTKLPTGIKGMNQRWPNLVSTWNSPGTTSTLPWSLEPQMMKIEFASPKCVEDDRVPPLRPGAYHVG